MEKQRIEIALLHKRIARLEATVFRIARRLEDWGLPLEAYIREDADDRAFANKVREALNAARDTIPNAR